MTTRITVNTRLIALAGAVSLLMVVAWAHAQLASDSSPPFSTVVYRGYLEHEGRPVDGTIDLSIDPFDAATGGTRLVSSALTFDDVPIAAGQFAVELALPVELLRSSGVWLAVSLDAGEGLVTLDGRQRLTSVPYAQLAHAAQTADDGNPPGTVVAFAGATAASGWLPCDGSAVSREMYARLYAAIGTTWGPGDGSSTFNLPDLRGRTVVGTGHGRGLTARALAELLGEETHTLTIAEMPLHSHGVVTVPSWDDGGGYSGGGWFGDPRPIETAAVGGGQSHNVLQPSAVLTYLIKY